jgi:hypothetical protein
VTRKIVRNSPTLVDGKGFDQLKSGSSLPPLGLAFGMQQGFLPVRPMAGGMSRQHLHRRHATVAECPSLGQPPPGPSWQQLQRWNGEVTVGVSGGLGKELFSERRAPAVWKPARTVAQSDTFALFCDDRWGSEGEARTGDLASLPFGVWIGLPLRYENSKVEQNISHPFELSFLTTIEA